MTVLKVVTAEPLADPALSVVGVGAGEGGLEPNHVYIVPFAHDVVIEAGVLKVLPCDEGAPTLAPVDCVLQSLAKTHRDRGIGILLSGTGHDGTSGLEADLNVLGAKLARLSSARINARSSPHKPVAARSSAHKLVGSSSRAGLHVPPGAV